MRELTALQRSARELSASLDPNRIVDETLAHAIDIANGDAGLIAMSPGKTDHGLDRSASRATA